MFDIVFIICMFVSFTDSVWPFCLNIVHWRGFITCRLILCLPTFPESSMPVCDQSEQCFRRTFDPKLESLCDWSFQPETLGIVGNDVRLIRLRKAKAECTSC